MSPAHHPQSPFLAFAGDEKDLTTLKAFADKHGWPDTCILQGDIKTATQFLKDHTSPSTLLVEIPSAAEASALLNGLAEVCDPDTKVIATGTVNEYSFYCWLMDLGLFSYLLKPLTEEALEGAYAKTVENPGGPGGAAKAPGKLIAVMGTRGGVGATSIAINLAGLIAETAKKSVALADIDPQEGSIALALDLEPSRGLREALEKPDRIDSLFLDRVMSRHGKHLAILSSEESLQEHLNVNEHAADAMLKELREKFDYVVLDIPRHLNPFSRKCLGQAEHTLLVTELTLLSLRDALRFSDLMRESLKMKPPMIVANRVGMTKLQMGKADFEKGINGTVSCSIPFAADVYMHISNDIPAVKFKSHSAVKPLVQLMEQMLPELKAAKPVKGEKAKEPKESKGGLFGGKKKE